MALHFSDHLPNTSAVHVVVMCGSSVSYSFCMYVCPLLSLLCNHCMLKATSVCVCVCVCVRACVRACVLLVFI